MSNAPMTRPNEMLAFHDGHFGGNTFVGLEGGRILFSSGTHFSISSDGGITWSEPFQGKDENGAPLVGGTSLVRLTDGAIGMATRRVKPESPGFNESQMVFRTSEDEGETWSPLTVMNQGMLRAHALQDTMIRTVSGRIILPVYFAIGEKAIHRKGTPITGAYLNGMFVSTDTHFSDARFFASYVLYSDDEGKTWQTNQDGEILIQQEYGGSLEVTNEPSLVEVTPGRLLMLLRTRLGRMFQSWSEDNGENWSRPTPTQLAGTQTPAQIRKLPRTGHLLVVWTQQSEKEIRQGFIRTRLSAAISRNEGLAWEHFQNIESLHEETYVEPGPMYPVRPEGAYGGYDGAIVCDPDYVINLPEGYGMWSYPTVHVADDRVLVSYNNYLPDPNTGKTIRGYRMKVLPISWFYGGRDPTAGNEALSRMA